MQHHVELTCHDYDHHEDTGVLAAVDEEPERQCPADHRAGDKHEHHLHLQRRRAIGM
ncbi:hypothetical protein [Rhodococcus ruber]|uniref:hypothetical protein n=1 Tax=Rhodococcus ruber TaxID=1830 RepID=UPI0013C4666C|nr:hypothetical protein [Rhodococcus ruber]